MLAGEHAAVGEVGAVGGVPLQLVAQCGEGERLEQVLHDAQGHRGTDDGEVPRGGDRDDVDTVPRGPQCPTDVEPVHVRQAHVEQDEIDRPVRDAPPRVGYGGAQTLQGLQRLLAGRRVPDNREARDPPDVGSVRLRRDRVVLDDEDADDPPPTAGLVAAHRNPTFSAGSGNRTVKTAPRSLVTSIRPR